ncbi:Glutamate 5-kinase [Gemmata obscuriglobus]|uniref:Glutamate 5-kinase n=1 Tax=Gemmata obscuriglobus TaxID=114 RepID=A0A2Z3H537_9BACT|nr:glutamate 5-kinase [Gemmata obscuriglobus]AWM38235.1 glutamate 5-kinase [Gemmata obscuriglobus]QEG28861.1 Glutamate 5-kinase [Gemmata obscuriglobus]VTS07293.1 glutamate 5-kinase : Glutamate 5-kinase OS=Planctomyces maris DSM 8797 GN=proB PE=3 SV=1: AA_kinase: PUA [Gemmata obscuriglobus UQM 2246]
MIDPVRQDVVAGAGTVVIKVGTNVLADPTGRLDRHRIDSLADQLHRIRAGGRKVVLVTSGAIGAGVGKLGLGKRPADLAHLQACAAVGQSALMQLYQESLSRYGVHTAQILLTASDFENRARYLNARNTIATLFEYGALPIINENDTVSVAEIKFGDNDHLAAMVTNLLLAPLLVLLTNVDGLYSDDPRGNPDAKLLATVPNIDASVTGLAAATKSALGTGGMTSKLKAARLVTVAGEAVIMANGSLDGILDRVFGGEPVGTLFLPHGEGVSSRKRWFGLTVRPKGVFHLDAGARQAVLEGRSLLPVGVIAVEGEFRKGDVVSICDAAGAEMARGLTNYPSVAVERIRGLQTERIAAVLGTVPYPELVHRDNLVLTAQ